MIIVGKNIDNMHLKVGDKIKENVFVGAEDSEYCTVFISMGVQSCVITAIEDNYFIVKSDTKEFIKQLKQ